MNTDPIRAKFEKTVGRVFDLTTVSDEWGGEKYAHSHVDAIFFGFKLAEKGLKSDYEVDALAGATMASAMVNDDI